MTFVTNANVPALRHAGRDLLKSKEKALKEADAALDKLKNDHSKVMVLASVEKNTFYVCSETANCAIFKRPIGIPKK